MGCIIGFKKVANVTIIAISLIGTIIATIVECGTLITRNRTQKTNISRHTNTGISTKLAHVCQLITGNTIIRCSFTGLTVLVTFLAFGDSTRSHHKIVGLALKANVIVVAFITVI